MLHPDLQKLLDIALQDGIITDKERSILHNKAKAIGQDIDELDMIIEGELYKIEQEKKQPKIECPNCGSPILKTAIKCSFCKYEISKSEISGKNFIKQLQQKLEQIDKDAYEMNSRRKGLFSPEYAPIQVAMNKASIITTFTMPNDKENLIEFFLFCDSNADAHSNTSKFTFDGILNKHYFPAWYGKAKMGYEKLIFFINDDEDVKQIINKYKDKYGNENKSIFGKLFNKK